ncbi:MAG: transglycosylase domain-containing protein [Geovibrio sp.]|nr:transglycosylase domain-containing protein [Geovibrio sp.]
MFAVEDARFFEHGGVDMMGIMRAFVSNVKAGRVVEGGSTLTQQLVKIIYLTPEKKLKRKIKEAILAYRLDNFLEKEEILEMYLNQVYFGRGAYGVEAAAANYFGKKLPSSLWPRRL